MLKRFALSLALLIAAASAAFAQSNPNLVNGQIPTAAQWNSYFAAKEDVLGYTPVNRNGDIMAGRLVGSVNGTTAGWSLTCGTAPSAPVNGDIWCTTSGLFARINGASLLISSPPGRITVAATVDFNTSADTTFAVSLPPGFTRFLVESVRIYGASHSLTTATAGVFTGTGGTGIAIVTGASAITVSSSTDATNNNAQAMTVNNSATESYTAASVPNLYFRVGTTEGAAATATVAITLIPLT